jgi:hypothetical protein
MAKDKKMARGMPYAARDGNEKFRGKMSGRMAEVMGHASPVYSIDTNAEAYDMGRVNPMKQGTRGYPEQAWGYQY